MSDTDVTQMSTDELVEAYRDEIEQAVRTMWKRCIATMTPADMRACAVEGLLQAREGYDPDSETAFRVYAGSRIRGAIIDGRRRANWGPRTRETHCRDDNGADKLQEATRMAAPEVVETVTAGKHEMPTIEVLLMEPAEFGRMDFQVGGTQDREVTRQQLLALVSEAMDQLGDLERAIVRLHDIEEKTLSEVADEMCCSKSWAAKLRERALGEIKAYVREAFSDQETDEEGAALVEFGAALAA
ncbi:MAG: sigma-70 family RNA polymerase sigma factor [Bradymonadaceae bacterium]